MKVCLVSFIAPYTIPYINIYLKKIRENNDECDVVFWDRDGDCENKKDDNIHYIPISRNVKQYKFRIGRHLQYIPVIFCIRKYIKNGKYDRIIFLQTHAAVACKSIILKYYKKKYIVDIRDFTLENFFLFRKWEKTVIFNSYCTVISSRGYENFLPKYEYVVAHNYTPLNSDTVQEIRSKDKNTNCINISFIGNVRFYEMAKKLLILFSNDCRFCLDYIGTGAMKLEKFCKENNISNVTLHDKFRPEETVSFYKNCDLINNLYGNHNKYLDFALSNKLYYAAQFRIPVLVSKDTYSSEIAQKYNLGISWDPDEEQSLDRLYEMYCNFDRSKMDILADEFLSAVVYENTLFENRIEEFLKK